MRELTLSARIGFVLGIGGSLAGCSSARMSDHVSDQLFRERRYDEAVDHLKKGLQAQGENSRDELLYELDIGLALHTAGRFEESNQAFFKADRLSEIKDYTSLSAETATLFTSDNLKDYKGEDFERVLISTYLAMNYALMGDFENSQVEARRVNHKLEMMINLGKRKYKQSAFARYLSAILYEETGEYNDAYVDYKNTHDLMPGLPSLGLDLWRSARALGMPDEMARWDKEYHLTDAQHQAALLTAAKSRKGEIIVLYENGISPVKRPNPHFREVPKFYPRHNPVTVGQVEIGGQIRGVTVPMEDIQDTAIRNLDEKYGAMVAKKIAGIVGKEALGYGVARATDSPLLGLLFKAALYASDQADVRSWNLLPKDLQILRVPVDAGTYAVSLTPLGVAALPPKTIQVGAGKKVFVHFRYMP